ncbi:hypothetical protein B0T19DRAFT_397762 [Cercophora scortea]|uniref:AMP-activated protein kinase glycogen-binding domain-containing protein n=1 Tax=Cercophora scortea TaxID=314031 RepID=A0AAE0IVB4_9PEZI|nr:hypothetical protein B0T19DRAFT_397762 [Cercophora scortea]
MGTFTFKWPHHAEEVYVTGTFDNWSKSEQLVQNGDVFEKTVTLPEDSDKVYYKFVVDGDWTTDHTAPREKDHEGNENNVLFAADITKTPAPEAAPPAAIMSAILSTVTPESTTAQLAGAVPLESTKNDQTPPGGYPETPAADLNDDKQKEFKVSPLPATDGAVNPVTLEPGEKIPEGVVAGNINDNVTLDKESYEKSDRIPGLDTAAAAAADAPAPDVNDPEKEFKINPLPATEGALNPITLAPGEKIPDEVTAGNINSHVTLDKESYEKSDRIPGLEDIVLPPVTSNMIPESSLPITGGHDFTINSVSPESTTAALAGQVPLEKKPEEPVVPEIVKESQEKADFPPEASAISEEIKEKAAVEEELLEKVPTAPATSEGTAGEAPEPAKHSKTLAETVVASGTAAIAAAVGTAFAAKQTATDAAIEYSHKLPESVQHQLPAAFQQSAVASTQEKALETISPSVPAEVKESIKEAGTSAEAANNTAAVEGRKEVEAELLKEVEEVKPIEAAVVTEEPKPSEPAPETVSSSVPTEVKESIAEAGTSPEAAASTSAVEDKKEVEAELLEEVKPVEAEAEPSTKTEEVKSTVAPPAPTVEDEVPEVKPATNGTTAAAPEVAPVAAAATPAEPSKAVEAPAAATATAEKKKKNRLSAFISKMKHKVSSKDKA